MGWTSTWKICYWLKLYLAELQLAGPVSGGDVPQDAGHVDGPAHIGDGVEDEDPYDVEAEVDQRNL
jgi:hypothetical protein